MSWYVPSLQPEVAALLEAGKVVPRPPDVVRARAIIRARAALVTGEWFAPAIPSPRPGRRSRVAAAASLALAIGVAGALAALLDRSGWLRPVDAGSSSAFLTPSTQLAEPSPALAEPAASPGTVAVGDPQRPPQWVATARESCAAEVECLQRALVAFAGRDFRGALATLTKHARRFPRGWLAEEREALRVRSLAAVGRTDEARRAAATFGERFPRSVLLQSLREKTAAAE